MEENIVKFSRSVKMQFFLDKSGVFATTVLKNILKMTFLEPYEILEKRLSEILNTKTEKLFLITKQSLNGQLKSQFTQIFWLYGPNGVKQLKVSYVLGSEPIFFRSKLLLNRASSNRSIYEKGHSCK